MREIDRLCRVTLIASDQVCGAMSAAIKEDSLLDAFWGLQNSVHRLFQEAVDTQPESVRFLRRAYPGFARRITEVLHLAFKSKLTDTPGIKKSTEVINDTLMRLYQLERRS